MSKKNEMIERMQNNWTAWGGLHAGERAILQENWSQVECNSKNMWRPLNAGQQKSWEHSTCDIFRISPDWKPEFNKLTDITANLEAMRDDINKAIDIGIEAIKVITND